MNKKVILLSAVILILGVGSYFLFFFDSGNAGSDEPTNGEVTQDSLDAVDQEIQKQRETLLLEQSKPQDFLEIKVDPKKNLLGESVIEGEIYNKAKGTRYKDFELMIYWQDETGTVMDSAVEVIFENVDPGERITFKTKRKGPRKSKAIRVKLHSAHGVEQ